MLYLNRLTLRLKAFFQKDQLDHQLEDELAFYLAEQKAELLVAGLSEAEADKQARLLFGPVTNLAEQCRDTRRTQWLEDFSTDTAYGILSRPLPYPAPDRLIEIDEGMAGVGPITTIRSLARAVDYAGYLPNKQVNVFENGDAARLDASTATANLLSVLQVSPALGQWFTPAEEQAGQHRVAVLSHRIWRDRFNKEPAIHARRIVLNERPFMVVGVMPQSFAFPSPDTDLWVPIAMDSGKIGYMWGGGNLFSIGRLKPGETLAVPQAEIKPIINRTRELYPWRMPYLYGAAARIVRHDELLAKQVRDKLLVLSRNAAAPPDRLRQRRQSHAGPLDPARTRIRHARSPQCQSQPAPPPDPHRKPGTGNSRRPRRSLAALLIFETLPTLLPKDTPRLNEIMAAPSILLGAFASLLTLSLFALAPLFRRATVSSLQASLQLAFPQAPSAAPIATPAMPSSKASTANSSIPPAPNPSPALANQSHPCLLRYLGHPTPPRSPLQRFRLERSHHWSIHGQALLAQSKRHR